MPADPNRARDVFLAALELPSDQRPGYLAEACRGDADLRAEVDRLLLVANAEPGTIPESASSAPADAAGAFVPGDPGTVDLSGATPATQAFDPDAPRPEAVATEVHRQDPAAEASAGAEPSATTAAESASPALSSARVPTREGIGTVIAGRYSLVEVIGEGGMGSVYLASQTEPVKRQVAIKLIKTGMDSRVVQARFDAERQALALMDHPNIARIYDGGLTPSGQPFFVMELVKGVPLTEYCDRQRLTVNARLELFVVVCHAVQHAHQKGIIHRDLKPGNVPVTEVDGRPTPKVIDFGVAKATEVRLTDMSFEDVGAVVGTPAYMSPEQADPSSLDIDTRTDIYSLGVILYELLVGSPPLEAAQFRRGAIFEMLRMVREVEPPRPSTKLSAAEALPSIAANRSVEPARLAKLLQGELDWVVMKALEKDRTRRYDTANGFARDISRYLADEVVEARPPTPQYRLRKFVRRHKGQVIAASLILLALLAGIAGTTVGLLRAREQRNIAEHRLKQLMVANAKTETERTRAEQNFATARTVILDLGTRINQIETGETNPRLADLARKEALDKARAQFEKFREAQPDDVALMKQAALLHRFAANVSRLLNDYPAAMAANSAAIKISEELIARFPESAEYRRELALTLGDRSTIEKVLGKMQEASATLDRALKLAEGPQGKLPDSSHRRTLALIVSDQADLAYLLGRFDDAAQLSGRGALLLDQLKTAPANERLYIDAVYAAIAVNRIALSRREIGSTADAVAAHDDAVARMKALVGPKATRDVRYWDCEVRRERARTAVAVPEQREAALADLAELIPTSEKLAEEYPQVHFYEAGLASIYLYRGELLLALEQPEPAAAELMKSLAVSRMLLDRHGVLTRSMLIRGNTFLALGRARAAARNKSEALAFWKNAATVFEIALRIDPDNFYHKRGLADARRKLADLIQELLSEARSTLPKDSSQLADTLASIGLSFLQQKKWTEAQSLLRECLGIREKTQPDLWSTFNTQSLLGGALQGQKKYAEAEQLLLAGYAGMKQQEVTIPEPDKVRLPEALDLLIELYAATNKPDELKKWQVERAKYPPAKSPSPKPKRQDPNL
jgi:eukaryotic-like serine/threonine-protein kinase